MQQQKVKQGTVFETVFYSNPKRESPFRFRATHIDGKRAPKVILCDALHPGQVRRETTVAASMKPTTLISRPAPEPDSHRLLPPGAVHCL